MSATTLATPPTGPPTGTAGASADTNAIATADASASVSASVDANASASLPSAAYDALASTDLIPNGHGLELAPASAGDYFDLPLPYTIPSASGPWQPPAPSLAALPVDTSKTDPKPAFYKLQFGDDITGFSYYVRTLSVVIGRSVVSTCNMRLQEWLVSWRSEARVHPRPVIAS